MSAGTPTRTKARRDSAPASTSSPSTAASSSFASRLTTKGSLQPPSSTDRAKLSQKFGRFLGNILGSPSSSSYTNDSNPSPSSSTAMGSSERASRRGWVDLVPDQGTNPFLVSTEAPGASSSASSANRPVARTITLPSAPVSGGSGSSARPVSPILASANTFDSTDSGLGADPHSSTSSSAYAPPSPATWLRTRARAASSGALIPPSGTLKWASWSATLGRLSTANTTTAPGKGKKREATSSEDDSDDLLVEDEGYWEGQEETTRIDLIAQLPVEIALHVFFFLPASSLAACASVSKTWNAFASDNAVWRSLFYSQPSWALRSTYPPTSLIPASLPPILPPPSSSSISLSSLSLTSPGPSSSRSSRPASPSRTLSSSSRIRPFDGEGGNDAESESLLDWRAIYTKRSWVDQRWGEEGQSEVRVCKGHDDSVYCLQFDGEKLITGSRDKTIKVWSLATGECLETVAAHDASVLCLMFDEETGFLVSGGSDSKLIVWDLGGPGLPKKPLVKKHVLHGHTQGVLDVAINKDYIASCSKDMTLLIHSRKTLAHLHTLTGHAGPVNAIGLAGERVASASGDGKIRLWDLVSGECIRVLEGHERGLACIEFKGDYIVSGSNDRTMKIWSASTGECLHTLIGHTDLVRTLAFDPLSGRIVSGGYDKQILIWSLATGKVTQTLSSSHTSLVFDIKFDASKIVSASHDQRILVHDFGDAESARMFV